MNSFKEFLKEKGCCVNRANGLESCDWAVSQGNSEHTPQVIKVKDLGEWALNGVVDCYEEYKRDIKLQKEYNDYPVEMDKHFSILTQIATDCLGKETFGKLLKKELDKTKSKKKEKK